MAGRANVIRNWPEPVTIPSDTFGARYTVNGITQMERLGRAVGLTAVAGVGSTPGHSDFDLIPPWRDIRLVNIQNGVVTAQLGDPNFARDGSNGDVMVEIPKFYYKMIRRSETTQITSSYIDFWISNGPEDGFKLSPMHDRPSGVLDVAYVSAYTLNSAYTSITGAAPLEAARAATRTAIKAKASGYYPLDAQTWFCIQMLYLVEFANTNSQAMIGKGLSTMTGISPSGGADSIAWHTGRAAGDDGYTAVKYRHMENLWGNVTTGQILDGINLYTNRANTLYVGYCLNPDSYANNTSSAWAANYVATGHNVGIYAGNGTKVYFGDLSYPANLEWVWLPSPSGAGTDAARANLGFADTLANFYNATAADNFTYVVCVGGTYSGNTSNGLFCYAHNVAHGAATVAYRSIFLPPSV